MPNDPQALIMAGLKADWDQRFGSYSKREQKVMLLFQISLSFSTHRTCFSGLRNYWIRPLPISPSQDQAVGGSWNNYPKGGLGNLVYSSLSICSSNSTEVITASLSSLKSSQRCCHTKLPLAGLLAIWTLIETHTASVCPAFLGRAYVGSPGVGDPVQPAHPEHISHTNTHLSHRSGPLHHSHGCSLSLNVPPAWRGQTNLVICL